MPMPPDMEEFFKQLLTVDNALAKAQTDLHRAEVEAQEALTTAMKNPQSLTGTPPQKTGSLDDLYAAVEGLTDTDEVQDLLRANGNDVYRVAKILRPRFEPRKAFLLEAGFDADWLSYALPFWTLEAVKRHAPDPAQN